MESGSVIQYYHSLKKLSISLHSILPLGCNYYREEARIYWRGYQMGCGQINLGSLHLQCPSVSKGTGSDTSCTQ